MISLKTPITYDNWKLKSFLLSNHIAYASSYSDVVFIRPSLENMMHLKSVWGQFPIPIIEIRLSGYYNPKGVIYSNYAKWCADLKPECASSNLSRSIREDEEYKNYRKHWKTKGKIVYTR